MIALRFLNFSFIIEFMFNFRCYYKCYYHVQYFKLQALLLSALIFILFLLVCNDVFNCNDNQSSFLVNPCMRL